MAAPVKSPFVSRAREFPQERARRTFEALIDAARELFASRGFDATQTPDIAARAGVSVGTFYRYFDDKLEILLEVLGRALEHNYREVMAGLTPEALVGVERRHLIDHALTVLVDGITRDPELERTFHQMALREPRVAALKRALDDVARAQLASLIAAVCPRELVTDPEATTYVIHAGVLECAMAISGARGAPPISRERGLRALSEMVYRTLFGLEDR
jgi:AcrR family transcriptional regulator